MVTHNALQAEGLGKGPVVQHFIPGVPFDSPVDMKDGPIR